MADAGWREDCGLQDLTTYLDGQVVPRGAGVTVGQVETVWSGKYMPHRPGAGQGTEFAGKFFVDESGLATVSTHAATVGKYCYGNLTGLAGGVEEVRCWGSLDLFRKVLRVPTGVVQPVPVDVMTAAFVNVGNYNPELRHFDFAVCDSGFLAVASTLNGAGTQVPEALACSYNGLTVGVTSGNHGAGVTPAHIDGPGRIKPELVAPLANTSQSAGAVSSMAAVLCGAAPPEGRRPEVLKALLLAGATREECVGWDKTATRPLDETFGAGQANLFHSCRILEAGEGEPGTVAPRGWKLVTHDGGQDVQWIFVVPPGMKGAQFSFAATWNRQLERNEDRSLYEPLPVADVNLNLSGPGAPILQESRSAVDNIEHLYQLELAPGTYTVSMSADQAVEVAVAWRLEIDHRPVLSAGGPATLEMRGLYPGHLYTVERTTDLESWEEVEDFTAGGPEGYWNDPSPPATRMVFYRLRYWNP